MRTAKVMRVEEARQPSNPSKSARERYMHAYSLFSSVTRGVHRNRIYCEPSSRFVCIESVMLRDNEYFSFFFFFFFFEERKIDQPRRVDGSMDGLFRRWQSETETEKKNVTRRVNRNGE